MFPEINSTWQGFTILWSSDTIGRQIWVNIGWGNGLLLDGTKPLPQPMWTYVRKTQWHSSDSEGNFIQVIHQLAITTSTVSLEISYQQFHSNLPGANELKFHGSLTDLCSCLCCHTMDLLWEKFQWILPLYMNPISFKWKASVVSSVPSAIFIDFAWRN